MLVFVERRHECFARRLALRVSQQRVWEANMAVVILDKMVRKFSTKGAVQTVYTLTDGFMVSVLAGPGTLTTPDSDESEVAFLDPDWIPITDKVITTLSEPVVGYLSRESVAQMILILDLWLEYKPFLDRTTVTL